MNQSIDFQKAVQTVIRVIGSVLISAGAYPGYLIFEFYLSLDSGQDISILSSVRDSDPAS